MLLAATDVRLTTGTRTNDELDRVFKINGGGVHSVTKGFLPELRKGGQKKIVNMYARVRWPSNSGFQCSRASQFVDAGLDRHDAVVRTSQRPLARDFQGGSQHAYR